MAQHGPSCVDDILVRKISFIETSYDTCRFCANKWLRVVSTSAAALSSPRVNNTFFVEQQVEWQFAFDIHCNAFFLRFLVIDLLQFLFLPLLLSNSLLSVAFANAIYGIAYSLYFYIVFLGYLGRRKSIFLL